MAGRLPVLVLGGTGVFGSRICRRLARDRGLRIFVGGRQPAKSKRLAAEIRKDSPRADVRPCVVDLPGELPEVLDETKARLVIHTCGPFQGQDYRVPEICIEKGVHYLDLADDSAYVAGFRCLDEKARSRGVLAVSGVSSIPALSSAVVEHLRPQFETLSEIAIGIAPGNRAPRGLALVAGVLSGTGKPFWRWQDGAWRRVYGWQDVRRRELATSRMASLGPRWFSALDVPDGLLFPAEIPDLRTVMFHAGLELRILHWGLWLLSWPVRLGAITNLRAQAPVFRDIASWFEGWGSDRGGMYVDLVGRDAGGRILKRTWTLLAESGDGPWVPSIPAVVLARKLARDEIRERGAMPCLGLMKLEDFVSEIGGLRIDTEVT